jgi:hypothetical protein
MVVMGYRALAMLLSVGACRWNFSELRADDAGRDAVADSDVLPDAAGFAANLVFATSTQHAMLGMTIADGDQICADRAAEAQLPGVYRAWLSTTAEPAASRMAGQGWVRRDGKIVAQTLADVFGGRMLHPILLDENGVRLATTDRVATGTDSTGQVFSANCTDFTDAQESLLFGCADATGRSYSVCFSSGCTAARIYCWGIDRTAPLAVPVATGRRAFLATAFSSGNSTSSADTHCNTVAASHQFPGTYKALLSSTTVTAASRLSAAGETWVRLDGIPLAPTAADVLAGNWDVPLNVTQDGGYDNNFVWTGAAAIDQVGTAAGTCNDLLSVSQLLTPALGRASRIFPTAFAEGVGVTCATQASVYCLQE